MRKDILVLAVEWSASMFPLQILGAVGPDQENAFEDVSRVASALAEVGESGAQGAALSGRWDDSLDKSVKSFQDNHGLDIDGVLLPGGPTENQINLRLRPRFEPDPQMVAEPAAGVTKTDDNARTANASLDLGQNRRGFDRPDAEYFSSGAANRTISTERLDDASEPDRSPTARGFEYRPDPMGRVGWGEWIAPEGAVISPAAMPRISDEEAKLQETPSQDPVVDAGEAPAADGYKALMREIVHFTKPEMFDDPQAYIEALEATIQDGAVPASDEGRRFLELFGRIITTQRGFGAKRMQLPGALRTRQTYPSELGRRIDFVTRDRTRMGIEHAIAGSVPLKKKNHPEEDFVLKNSVLARI